MNAFKRSLLCLTLGLVLVATDVSAQTPAIPLDMIAQLVDVTAFAVEIIECPGKTDRKAYMLVSGDTHTMFIDAVKAKTDPGAIALVAELRKRGVIRGPIPIDAKCEGELSTWPAGGPRAGVYST